MPQQIHALESKTLLPHCTGLYNSACLSELSFLSLDFCCFLLLSLPFQLFPQSKTNLPATKQEIEQKAFHHTLHGFNLTRHIHIHMPQVKVAIQGCTWWTGFIKSWRDAIRLLANAGLWASNANPSYTAGSWSVTQVLGTVI